MDIVILLGHNEYDIIDKQIQYTRKNVSHFRKIYIVTPRLDLQIADCEIIHEDIFPFKSFLQNYFHQYKGKKNRNGWYFQQLIKLYAGEMIKGLLDDYLVLDADVIFLKPISFFTKSSKYIFTLGNECHQPYFAHMKRLHPSFQKMHPKSGIAHHMLLNRNYLKQMFDLVEEYHKGKSFWQVFIESVDEHKHHPIEFCESGASEYELYFNYMLKYHPDKIEIRDLNWINVKRNCDVEKKKRTFDFVSLCHYLH